MPLAYILILVIALCLLGYLSILTMGIFVTLPLVGYQRIRRLGYFPPSAATFVLGAVVVAVFAVIGTVVLLPKPGNPFGLFAEILACIVILILFPGFMCAALVRMLPKRNFRVFGRRRVRFPFVSLGYLVIAGAIAGGVVVVIIAPPESRTFDTIAQLLLLVLVIAGGGVTLIRTARRVKDQVPIEDATRLDPRSPVMFLRPFAAERAPFVRGPDSKYGKYSSQSQQWATSLRALPDAEGNRRDEDPTISIPFELYLGGTFRERLGPFIALGNPEDYLPPEGAIRTYADDEGWYEYFERLARRAVCMVMLVSNSDNLRQELTFLRSQGLQRRLFIFTATATLDVSEVPSFLRALLSAPPRWISSRLYGLADQSENLATWGQLAENLGRLGFDLGDDPGRGAVVTFDSEGKAMAVVTGAETPLEFVEPLREHLVRTFGIDFG